MIFQRQLYIAELNTSESKVSVDLQSNALRLKGMGGQSLSCKENGHFN